MEQVSAEPHGTAFHRPLMKRFPVESDGKNFNWYQMEWLPMASSGKSFQGYRTFNRIRWKVSKWMTYGDDFNGGIKWKAIHLGLMRRLKYIQFDGNHFS